MKHLFKCLLAAVSCCTVTASAITLTEAKKLYNNGDFEKALPVFRDYQKRNPRNASYNQWLGGCLYETGQSEEAVKYLEFALSKDIPDAARYLAQIALDNMDYASMEDYKRQFEELIDYDESDLSDRSREGYAKLKRTSELLNNVQHIEIFDSLTVDKKDFFKHYRISPETGTLKGIRCRGGFQVEEMRWVEGRLQAVTLTSTLGGTLRIRSAVPLRLDGKELTPAKNAECDNPLLQLQPVRKPLVDAQAPLSVPQAPQTYVYDVETVAGGSYTFVGD